MELVRADWLEARVLGLQHLGDARLMLENFDGVRAVIAHLDQLTAELERRWGPEHSYPNDCHGFIADLRQALDSSESLGPQVDRGFEAMEEGRTEEARRIFDELEQSEVVDARIVGTHGLAVLELSYGRIDAATTQIEALESLVEVCRRDHDRDNWYVQRWESVLRAVEAHRLRVLRRFEEALEHATRSLEFEDSEESRLTWVVALKHVGRLDEAIAECRRIVERGAIGDLAPARYCLAGYLHLAGEPGEAEAVHARIDAADRARLAGDEVWLAACRGDRKRCLELVEAALAEPRAERWRAYFAMEVELDPFRDDDRMPPASVPPKSG